ncbi:MAG: tRNA (adenosine(37)-N6)-threonylcarbamoyltransferase complex dimerization subunit type 1 TsaB [Bacteroidota bacterium]
MAIILHLETATKTCSVALSIDSKLIDVLEIHSYQFIHGEKLTLFIEEILTKNSISINHLSAVSISSGPGSYTGLRIGVATAKGLCYAKNIPLIAVDTLHAFENCARKSYPNQTICVMLDARRMEVYSSIFDTNSVQIKSLSADILDENSYQEFEPFVCIGDGGTKIIELWKERNILIDDSLHISASGQIDLAYGKFLAKDYVDLAYFEPNYLKEFYSGK